MDRYIYHAHYEKQATEELRLAVDAGGINNQEFYRSGIVEERRANEMLEIANYTKDLDQYYRAYKLFTWAQMYFSMATDVE